MSSTMSTSSAVRVRLVTYNVLLGGRYREQRLAGVLARSGADVIALQEVIDLGVVRRLAKQLGMTPLIGRPSDPASLLHNAILTHLPVRRWRNHRHPDRMLRGHLEAEIELPSRRRRTLRIHCLHLAARFGEKANGEARRMRELDAVINDIDTLAPIPHLIVGDFNAIAPGDQVDASHFLERIAELHRAGVFSRGRDGLWGPQERGAATDPKLDAMWLSVGIDPHLDISVPRLPGLVPRVTRALPRGPGVDRVLNRLIERWSVERLLDAGYTDCFRAVHPRAAGYTCATWMPAARIDYVFATEWLAERVTACAVIGSRMRPDTEALTASDHLPVAADFLI